MKKGASILPPPQKYFRHQSSQGQALGFYAVLFHYFQKCFGD